jgi:hypothetical protein
VIRIMKNEKHRNLIYLVGRLEFVVLAVINEVKEVLGIGGGR